MDAGFPIDALPGELASRYRALALLGEGTFGCVVEAQDLELDRVVAVKLLKDPLAEAKLAERFRREAVTTARLRHRNVVLLLDFGLTQDLRPYLVYERIPGSDLRTALQSGREFLPQDVRAISIQLAEALAAAHDLGIVHRDVKPENVLLRGPADPVLCDFGLARDQAHDTRTFTTRGVLVGTPCYLAPEMWRGAPATASSDQFSLAATLYELAYRRRLVKPSYVTRFLAADEAPLEFQLSSEERRRDPVLAELLERAASVDPRKRLPGLRSLSERLRRANDQLSRSTTGILAPVVSQAQPVVAPDLEASRSFATRVALSAILACGLAAAALLFVSREIVPAAPGATGSPRDRDLVGRVGRELDDLVRVHLLHGDTAPDSSSWDHVQEIHARLLDPILPLKWKRLLEGVELLLDSRVADRSPEARRVLREASLVWGTHVLRDVQRLETLSREFMLLDKVSARHPDPGGLFQAGRAQWNDIAASTAAFVDRRIATGGLGHEMELLVLASLSYHLDSSHTPALVEAVYSRVIHGFPGRRHLDLEAVQAELLDHVFDLGHLPCEVRRRVVRGMVRRLLAEPSPLALPDRVALLSVYARELVRLASLCRQAPDPVDFEDLEESLRTLEHLLEPSLADPIHEATHKIPSLLRRHLFDPPPTLARALERVQRLRDRTHGMVTCEDAEASSGPGPGSAPR